ncbi:hypothetical protein DB30_08072 [Enhygromyxa salina]|uniref:DNA-binding domain-containing protein n=1 Tax=Enhygromyxa salina TaxID=215803 RepID=A0A0C2CV33_9BACT|nr:hypothetical protein [Enhygromyxa salina]KIG13445.1 hypothetical protein DB30_08072 [Enhygromyxa salina]
MSSLPTKNQSTKASASGGEALARAEPTLERFYGEIAPFLFGETSVGAVEQRLGRSASGSDNLEFYRVLVRRNFDRILSELFVSVHTLVTRDHPGLWPQLVSDYLQANQTGPRDPNLFGLAFSDFLAARRDQGGGYSPALEELADYHMCSYLAASAQDDPEEGDGFEVRLFVRGYTFPVIEIAKALAKDRATPLPEPRPATLFIYRSLHPPHAVRIHWPTAPQLAALARRQGVALPASLSGFEVDAVDDGLAQLISAGVLRAEL